MNIILSAKSVYPFHPVGGVQKYVYYFAKHLARKGIQLEIVAPCDDGRPRTEDYEGLQYTFLKPSIYRYLEYPAGWFGVHLFSRALNRYLQNKSFDLLHSFDMTGYRYLRNTRRRPTIVHMFTDNYLSNPISLKNPFHLFNLTGSQFDRIKKEKVKLSPFADKATRAKYFMQYAFKVKPMYECVRRCDTVFFETDVFQDEVNELYHLPAGKSAVIPVGVDIPFIQKAVETARVSRSELGFGDDDIVLMTVNRLAADKGVDKIVLALERIVREIPHVKLLIVGSGYQEREILDLVKQKGLQGHVRHLKNVPEDKLYPYYRMSDIYISAFSYPGSSISTLEAMACSLPIITTAQPWLVDERRNGMVLDNNAAESIYRAVVKLIGQKKLKEQGAVSEEIVRDFDWDKIAERAMRQYERVLQKDTVAR